MESCGSSALRAWAASGAMALTGRGTGPPRAAPGRAAARVSDALTRFSRTTYERTGLRPYLPGVELLGERAAIAGLSRRGSVSCGGAFRILRTDQGWLGLSLTHTSDFALIPALVKKPAPVEDPWAEVTRWARTRTTSQALQRLAAVGLTGTAVPVLGVDSRAGVEITVAGPRRRHREHPIVIDLTSHWAGPLCSHLLGLSGARVIKVEDLTRPDAARFGPPGFFDLLHHGHHMVGLDLHDRDDIDRLHELISEADLVLETSLPRPMRELGLDAETCVAAGTSWLSITPSGRDGEAIGSGNDIAAAAGLVVAEGREMLPCGDAVADPLSGVCAAQAANEALLDEHARLIDVSMLHLTAEIATGAPEPHVTRYDGCRWWVETADSRFPVAPPIARRSPGRAGNLSADNAAVLGALPRQPARHRITRPGDFARPARRFDPAACPRPER